MICFYILLYIYLFSFFFFFSSRRRHTRFDCDWSSDVCSSDLVAVQNLLGLSLQFRISPEWRTEASFAPVQTCLDAATGGQGTTIPRQVGLDLFWEKRY